MKVTSYDYEEKYTVENQTFWVQIEYRIHTMTWLIQFMREDRIVVSYTWPTNEAPQQHDLNSIATVAAGAFIMHDIAAANKAREEEDEPTQV